MTIRHLILLLGDQLDERSSALLEADPAQDVVLMIEAQEAIPRYMPGCKVRSIDFEPLTKVGYDWYHFRNR